MRTLLLASTLVSALGLANGCSNPTEVPPARPDADIPAGDGGVDASNATPSDTGSGALSCVPFPGNPPPEPSPGDAGSNEGRLTDSIVFAVSGVWLGDVDPNGAPDSNAWQYFGYNIDGKTTTSSSSDVCTRVMGAPPSIQVDGCNGIDNSFGANIISMVTQEVSGISGIVSTSIGTGQASILLKIDGLTPGTTSASGLRAAIYGGAALGGKPKFDGTDSWPVDTETVQDGDTAKPLMTFGEGYITQSTWVSGPSTGTTSIYLPTKAGGALNFPLTHATISMRIAADGQSASEGILSAIAPTELLVESLREQAGIISSSLCSDDAFAPNAAWIRRAQDVLADGTNSPGTPCNAISVGIGFTAHLAKMGSVQTVRPPKRCGG